ncbi:protein translocase subunit SecA-like [Symsagittifera roscoffensis]|uniref:protein translocase subunit SecA-like n=1 Tax=Symsagittifera roscoffensis TaxID=84072 RepID=UPI00307CB818
MLHMFKHCEDFGLDNLVRVMIWKLSFEEVKVDKIDMELIMSHILGDRIIYDERDYLILFGAFPQIEWLPALLTLQLRQAIELTVADRIEIQKFLAGIDNRPLMRLLSLKLHQDKTCDCSLDDIKALFENSTLIELDEEIAAQLLAIGLGAWPLRLLWLETVLQISLLKVNPEMESEDLEELSYYMGEIRQKCGDADTSELLAILSEFTNLGKTELKTALRNLYRNKWVLDKNTKSILRNHSSSEWSYNVSLNLRSSQPRSIEQLTNLMEDDSTNSERVQKILLSCKNKVNKIEKTGSLRSNILVLFKTKARGEIFSLRCQELNLRSKDFIHKIKSEIARLNRKVSDNKESVLKNISQWTEKDVENWVKSFTWDYFKDIKSNYWIETLCVIDQAIYLKVGFHLRATQLLAVVIFIETGNAGILEQISTGEGKSLIIATLAIYKALVENENVDIITSSVVLAERDAKEHKELYRLFGLNAEHNNVDGMNKRQEMYSKSHVIYGDISCFQRDLLLDRFYNVGNGIESRKVGCVIVDEVDSMLIDKGNNTLYLSHNIPGMDALEPLYVHMWTVAHAHGVTGSEKDVAAIELTTRQAMHPLLVKDELRDRTDVEEMKLERVWEELIRLEIIDKHGEILDGNQLLTDSKTLNKLHKNKIELTYLEKGKIVSLIKDSSRRRTTVEIPNNLRQFVGLHLKEWAENALLARRMNVNEDYIIDIDRSETARRTEPNIVIMDNYTGEEQYSSQWSSGLHQFLQLKHSCRLSMESLKAVFISNTKFFERYGSNLFGLSGTLGSQSERNFLKNIYRVDFCKIPTFKESRFEEITPALFRHRDTWLKALTQECVRITHEKQVVLVICENIEQVNIVETAFKKLMPANSPANTSKMAVGESKKFLECPLHVCTRSYVPIVGSEEEITEPCVIVSTNLAGRGTDIKINEELSEKGGLHVCVAYMPPNVRIEEQAFGRTARKGQKGSGQIICCDETKTSQDRVSSFADFFQQKTERNKNEEKIVNDLEATYKNYTKPEENLLEQFKDSYKLLSQHLISKNKGILNRLFTDVKKKEQVMNIILNNCLDSWAFLLDQLGATQKHDLKNASIKEFLNKISDAIELDNAQEQLIDRSAQKIQYANLIEDDTGLKKLNEVISDDCHYRAIAQYYSAHSLIKKYNHNRKDNPRECEMVFKLLRSSLMNLKNRQEKLAEWIVTVGEIAKSYSNTGPSFVLVNDYETQKQEITGILEVFVDSIRNVLGFELSSSLIQSEGIDPDQAQQFLQELICNKLVKNPCVVSKQWLELRQKYALHEQDIDAFLDRNEGKEIKKDDMKGLLPSREDFWDEMRKSRFIKMKSDLYLCKKKLRKIYWQKIIRNFTKKLNRLFLRQARQRQFY